jgi:predicted ribosomally synthesized peptide with nif11-like leader
VSTEGAVAFVEKSKSDEGFQSKLAEAGSPEERLALARAEGFDVGPGDVGAMKNALGIQELSDEDLERVAGGMGSTTVGTIASGGSVVVGAVAGEVAAAFI